MSAKRRRKRFGKPDTRRFSAKAGAILFALTALHTLFSVWFVHHPRQWIERRCEMLPAFAANSIVQTGSMVGDITDGLGLTGHDAVYEYDEEAPAGSIAFAGLPVRTGSPAPDDIVTLDRGPFIVGWSPSLRHPLWCAYHVIPDAAYMESPRPDFRHDRSAERSPLAGDYLKSGFDRGHMAPNYAIVTRYGPDAQAKTFFMSNIAPQSPALNRKVWRDFEHRIAELWTKRYGEIWVIVGAIPSSTGQKLGKTDIDIPESFYQLVIAQKGFDVRALAVLLPNNVSWSEWAARNIITIDELEEKTGLDFLSDLPDFIESPLEAELPSRLWPIRPIDIISQFASRFK